MTTTTIRNAKKARGVVGEAELDRLMAGTPAEFEKALRLMTPAQWDSRFHAMLKKNEALERERELLGQELAQARRKLEGQLSE